MQNCVFLIDLCYPIVIYNVNRNEKGWKCAIFNVTLQSEKRFGYKCMSTIFD